MLNFYKIILKIKINSSDNLDRISQLTQKVNQFNSTSLRMSKQDVKNFIKNKNNFVFQVEAKDIYGDYGIIGLAFVEFKKDKEAKISNFLLKNEKVAEGIAKMHPMKRIGQGEDSASVAKFLLTDESSWITGQILGVDGGRSSVA